MSGRGTHVLEAADGQINELIGLLSAADEASLSVPCPGREKVGDGTVGALASHTAESYLRIAAFLQATRQTPSTGPSRDRIPRLLRARSRMPPRHAKAGHNDGMHGRDYAAENVELPGLLGRLSAGRDALSLLADLTDEQLDTAPPTGSFRFCDGQRTAEQVVASLLKHQAHQIDAVKAAIA